MAQKDVAAQIGNAWALHRQGKHENAIAEFSQAMKSAPDNIDAVYGLGLSQRGAKMREAAIRTFEQCQQMVAAALQTDPTSDRLEILEKMCQQRLAELRQE
jgi:tetratricopeptide (TPR) repeat protein